MEKLQIKEALYQACIQFVVSKQKTIEDSVKSNQEALDSESKSSAGDKHETGRAMLQLEMEKSGQQLKEVHQMKLLVEKMQVSNLSEIAALGSVVITEGANYFLGISVGKVELGQISYYIISPSAPIGRLLLGKEKNEEFIFQGKQLKILEVF